MFRSSLVAGRFIAATLAPTAAQQPTQAQRDALRAACRSDFMANCASVQPGGKEALECLQRHDPKLSAPCRSVVNAIATPASSAAAPAPTAATPSKPSDASAPAQPTAAAPPATKTPTAAPTRKTTAMRATTTPAATSAAASGSASAPTAAPAVAPLGPIRPMLPRRALMILAQCRPEQQRLCAGIPASGGKILSCLAANAQQLSPTCYEALARVSE